MIALSSRQVAILTGLDNGETYADAAVRARCSEATVQKEVNRLREAYGLSCVRLIAAKARERGMLVGKGRNAVLPRCIHGAAPSCSTCRAQDRQFRKRLNARVSAFLLSRSLEEVK